jgi:hypothetical protein
MDTGNAQVYLAFCDVFGNKTPRFAHTSAGRSCACPAARLRFVYDRNPAYPWGWVHGLTSFSVWLAIVEDDPNVGRRQLPVCKQLESSSLG